MFFLQRLQQQQCKAADMTPKGPVLVVGYKDPYDGIVFSGTTRSMTLALGRNIDNGFTYCVMVC
jgi:hypothetical protein